ncbi:transcriptional repressor [Streptomyces gardneri]|nr:transcriptional repressor [Streptomyces gardneri]
MRQAQRYTAERACEPGSESPHRDAILAILAEEECSLTAREVYLELARRRTEPVGLTTVYRVLHRLVADRWAVTLHAEDGPVRYRPIEPGAPDRNLLCRRCGRAVPFSAPEVEKFCDEVARRHGFADAHHQIRLHGICPAAESRRSSVRSTSERSGSPHRRVTAGRHTALKYAHSTI